jgi:opacity protein-like surface antigen
MNNKVKKLSVLIVLLSWAASPWVHAAEDLVGQWYMQPRLNLDNQSDNFQHINHQTISIGRTLHKRIDLEINLLSDGLDDTNNSQSILIDGRYYLNPVGQFSPYIAGGIARTKNLNSIDSSYQDPITNIGLGFEHTLKGNGTKIQADIRYFVDDRQNNALDNNKNLDDWALSLGVSIPLSSDTFK